MTFLHHFCRHIHIDNKLELQAIVNGCQIKLLISRFIINHLNIYVIFILTGIQTVNPAPELHLLFLRKRNIHCIQVFHSRKAHLERLRQEFSAL